MYSVAGVAVGAIRATVTAAVETYVKFAATTTTTTKYIKQLNQIHATVNLAAQSHCCYRMLLPQKFHNPKKDHVVCLRLGSLFCPCFCFTSFYSNDWSVWDQRVSQWCLFWFVLMRSLRIFIIFGFQLNRYWMDKWTIFRISSQILPVWWTMHLNYSKLKSNYA